MMIIQAGYQAHSFPNKKELQLSDLDGDTLESIDSYIISQQSPN